MTTRCTLAYEILPNTYGVTLTTENPPRISIYTTDTTLTGTTATIELKARGRAGGYTSATAKFNVTIDDTCLQQGTTIFFSVAPTPTMTFTIGSGAPASQSLYGNDSFSNNSGVANACGAYAFSIAETQTFASVHATSGVLTINTSDVTNHGTHTITAQVGIAEKPYTFATASITVTIIDLCRTASISFTSAPADMTWEMGSATVTQNTLFTDSVSTSKNTAAYCGAYIFSIAET